MATKGGGGCIVAACLLWAAFLAFSSHSRAAFSFSDPLRVNNNVSWLKWKPPVEPKKAKELRGVAGNPS